MTWLIWTIVGALLIVLLVRGMRERRDDVRIWDSMYGPATSAWKRHWFVFKYYAKPFIGILGFAALLFAISATATASEPTIAERIETRKARIALTRACDEFRSKRLIDIAAEEAWQQAMSRTDGADTAATAARASARADLSAAQGAVNQIIYRRGDVWAGVLENLASKVAGIYTLRVTLVTTVETSEEQMDSWIELRHALYEAQESLSAAIHQSILLACEQPANPLAHLRSQ